MCDPYILCTFLNYKLFNTNTNINNFIDISNVSLYWLLQVCNEQVNKSIYHQGLHSLLEGTELKFCNPTLVNRPEVVDIGVNTI